MQNSIQRYIILPGLVLLLFWSVLEYGGRYLYGQTLAQVLCGGLLVLLTLSQIRTHEKLSAYPLLKATGVWLIVLCISWIFSVNRLASLEELLRYLMYLLLPVLIFF